jgi:hypothetical protein
MNEMTDEWAKEFGLGKRDGRYFPTCPHCESPSIESGEGFAPPGEYACEEDKERATPGYAKCLSCGYIETWGSPPGWHRRLFPEPPAAEPERG